MISRGWKAWALACALFFTLTHAALANFYYAAPNGSTNGGSGTLGSPWTNLYSIQQLNGGTGPAPGDTVVLLAGCDSPTYASNYTGALYTLTTWTGGTAGNPVTIESDCALPTTGAPTNGPTFFTTSTLGDILIQAHLGYITFRGIILQSNDSTNVANCVQVSTDSNQSNPTNNLVFDHMTISNCPANGLSLNQVNGVVVSNSIFHDTSYLATVACNSALSDLHPTGSNNSFIINNIFYRIYNQQLCDDGAGSDGEAIELDQGYAGYGTLPLPTGTIFIGNNLCFFNGSFCVNDYGIPHVRIVGNTGYLDNSDMSGQTPAGTSTHTTANWGEFQCNGANAYGRAFDCGIVNNIAWTNTNTKAAVGCNHCDSSFATNNLSYNDNGAVYNNDSTGWVASANVFGVNPNFAAASTNPATANFALSAGSGAIGIGTTAYLSTTQLATDLLGAQRLTSSVGAIQQPSIRIALKGRRLLYGLPGFGSSACPVIDAGAFTYSSTQPTC